MTTTHTPDSIDDLALDDDTMTTGLEALQAALDTDMVETKRLPITGVKGREGWELEITLGDSERFGEKLRKFAIIARGGKNKPDSDYDGYVNASLVIAETVTGIYARGKLLVEDDGARLTFRSKSVLELTRQRTAAEAARKFIASDAFLLKLSTKILELAGYDNTEVDTVDPDQGRSDG